MVKEKRYLGYSYVDLKVSAKSAHVFIDKANLKKIAIMLLKADNDVEMVLLFKDTKSTLGIYEKVD